jgi:hypothetical protein
MSSNAVPCRGCGIDVGRDARFCWICKCPYPACHLTEESDPAAEILEALPAHSFRVPGWVLAIPAGLGLVCVGVVVVGTCVLAAHWDRVQARGLPSVHTFITRLR